MKASSLIHSMNGSIYVCKRHKDCVVAALKYSGRQQLEIEAIKEGEHDCKGCVMEAKKKC